MLLCIYDSRLAQRTAQPGPCWACTLYPAGPWTLLGLTWFLGFDVQGVLCVSLLSNTKKKNVQLVRDQCTITYSRNAVHLFFIVLFFLNHFIH